MESSAIEASVSASSKVTCQTYQDSEWGESPLSVPDEISLRIRINGSDLISILCSPLKLDYLVVGYLFSEGIISNLGDIKEMAINRDEGIADVILKNRNFSPPEKKILTSGFGSGISFIESVSGPAISSDLLVPSTTLLHLADLMKESASLYKNSGGVHASAICDCTGMLAEAEDLGRHNTLDKVIGECLIRNIITRDKILLTTGRISSEMLRKGFMMKTPVITSFKTPTDKAINMAKSLGITLVGHLRNNHFSVYSLPERIGMVR